MKYFPRSRTEPICFSITVVSGKTPLMIGSLFSWNSCENSRRWLQSLFEVGHVLPPRGNMGNVIDFFFWRGWWLSVEVTELKCSHGCYWNKHNTMSWTNANSVQMCLEGCDRIFLQSRTSFLAHRGHRSRGYRSVYQRDVYIFFWNYYYYCY